VSPDGIRSGNLPNQSRKRLKLEQMCLLQCAMQTTETYVLRKLDYSFLLFVDCEKLQRFLQHTSGTSLTYMKWRGGGGEKQEQHRWWKRRRGEILNVTWQCRIGCSNGDGCPVTEIDMAVVPAKTVPEGQCNDETGKSREDQRKENTHLDRSIFVRRMTV